MLKLQHNDPEAWVFLDGGNFIQITASNKNIQKMKIKGVFIGITDNEHALEKYFIIAPTLCKIVQEFKEYAEIQTESKVLFITQP